MNETYTHLTEAEWKIMLKLWDNSPQTMMQLTRALEAETGWSKHTVITMLKRMGAKGTVHICEDGPVKTYTPAVSRERVAREQTQTLLTRLFGGKASTLMNELVEEGQLNQEELCHLRQLIDQAAQKKQQKDNPGETNPPV